MAEVSDLIDRGGVRLVTLTGTGGTGKTRLAVAVAAELEHRSARDTYFVPLHTSDRAVLMWSGIAEAVSAPADANESPEERALSFLADRSAFEDFDADAKGERGYGIGNLDQLAIEHLMGAR